MLAIASVTASSTTVSKAFPRLSPLSGPLRTYVTESEPVKSKLPVAAQATLFTNACTNNRRVPSSRVRMQAEVEAEAELAAVAAPAAAVAAVAAPAPAAAEPIPYPTELLEELGGVSVETGGQIWDPLGLAAMPEADLTYYRQAEIKHGRVAMLATVGYAVAKAGVVLPGYLSRNLAFADVVTANPFDEWANVPEMGKVQLFTLAAFIELSPYQDPDAPGSGMPMKGLPSKDGNKIGENPLLQKWLPWLPRGAPADATQAAKRKESRMAELKNGRLAMIGIAGLYASETIPGSVPFHF